RPGARVDGGVCVAPRRAGSERAGAARRDGHGEPRARPQAAEERGAARGRGDRAARLGAARRSDAPTAAAPAGARAGGELPQRRAPRGTRRRGGAAMSALRRDTPAQASERSSRRGTSRGAGGQRGGGLRGRAWDWRGWLIAGLCAGVTASAQVAGAAESAAGGAVAESEAASKTSTPPVYPLQCGGAAALRVVDAPRLPPPTPEQVRALRLLEEEAEGYLADAKRFQGTLTTIVRHHYEERRRRVLSTLDREIDMERKELLEARAEAIRRLEDFVARYSGANADPQATPDAMFRLAALYEERARDDYDADLTEGLRPAIDIYRSIVEQYPAYQESAAVHYYLGHALTDAGRLEEGQQAWRSLVCANRY